MICQYLDFSLPGRSRVLDKHLWALDFYVSREFSQSFECYAKTKQFWVDNSEQVMSKNWG